MTKDRDSTKRLSSRGALLVTVAFIVVVVLAALWAVRHDSVIRTRTAVICNAELTGDPGFPVDVQTDAGTFRLDDNTPVDGQDLTAEEVFQTLQKGHSYTFTTQGMGFLFFANPQIKSITSVPDKGTSDGSAEEQDPPNGDCDT